MRKLVCIVAILGLSACQPLTVQHTDGTVPFAVRVDDEAYWLEEWHRVIALPDDQLVQTLKAREVEFERSAAPGTRLRLALLLAEGPQHVRNQERALELLTELDSERASESARALATLLKQVIDEQRRSNDEMAELSRKLRDCRTQIEGLKLQLQELTTIEKNIQQRELPNSMKE
jgi:hypothetical protein